MKRFLMVLTPSLASLGIGAVAVAQSNPARVAPMQASERAPSEPTVASPGAPNQGSAASDTERKSARK